MSVINAPVYLTASFTDAGGTPVDPTTVTLNVTLPDGTTPGPLAAIRDSAGVYHYSYTPALTGIYQWYFLGTGANAATLPPDIFTVSPLATAALISLDDARATLNKTSHVDDDELRSCIHAATEIINNECGYTIAQTFTETPTPSIDGMGRRVLMLSRTPVVSVSAVTPLLTGFPAVDITTLVINKESGILFLGNWYSWYGPQSVTYVAGRTYVPAGLQEACKLIVQYLWESQRGGSTSIPGMGGDDTETYGGMPGFPTRALDLMRMSPYYAAPGLA